MKIFFDTEFTGLNRDAQLISIGLIAEDGNTFYAEFTDYDKDVCSEWVTENVISNLKLKDELEGFSKNIRTPDGLRHLQCKGDKQAIAECLTWWLCVYYDRYDKIEMWSDCLAYDWMLFCDLFGGAMGIPDWIYYIPFDISTMFKLKGVNPDISREEYAGIKDVENKHNALHDAEIMKKCYERLNRIHNASATEYMV